MKKLLFSAALVCLAATQSANALSIDAFKITGFGNLPVPGAGTITFDPPATPVPGLDLSLGGVIMNQTGGPDGAQPFPYGASNYYLSVLGDTVAPLTGATLSFGSTKSAVSFLWGSVDTYNTFNLYLGATLVGTVTGSQVITVVDPDLVSGNQQEFGTAYVTISGIAGGFDKVEFLSTTNSFEVDNISTVPDGGMTLALLGMGMTGIAYLRRKLA